MSNLLVDLQNSANWDELYSGQFTAVPIPGLGQKYYPIPDYDIGLQVGERLLAVYASSQSADSRYWLGCRLVQIIPVAGMAGGIRVRRARIALNQWSLVEFPPIASEYAIKIEFPWWLADVWVVVARYIGPLDFSDEQLIGDSTTLIRSDIAALTAKVDTLL